MAAGYINLDGGRVFLLLLECSAETRGRRRRHRVSPSPAGFTREMSCAASEVRCDTTMAAAASPVQQFYAGACVLVTGGTGFMGKVLLEKLLWACPDITAIYVLVRPKKAVAAADRITALLASPCFDRLRAARGAGFEQQLVGVEGDVATPRLGVSDVDAAMLARNVHVVFHAAATVRFDMALHDAVMQNVRGTTELLQLCKTFKQLKAVVHVSTAYANCPWSDIEEKFYDSPLDCDTAINMAAAHARALAAGEPATAMTDKLLGAWPNSYSFTKAVAEQAVLRHGHGLPVCVFRPAVVLPSMHEPCPGWVDNLAGPGAVLAGTMTGYLRVMPGDGRVQAALVPCDMVINGMIAAAWHTATNRTGDEPAIYNYTPSPSNTITWQKYFKAYKYHLKEMPSAKAIWIPNCVVFSSHTMLFLFRLVLQTFPAAIADLGLLLTGRKPFVSRLYGKITKATDSTHFFAIREWRFEEHNVASLWQSMDAADRRLLDFDMRALDWDHYIKLTSPGIRRFILKEDPVTIPAAKERYRKMKLAKWIFQMMMYLIAMSVIVPGLLNLDNYTFASSSPQHETTQTDSLHCAAILAQEERPGCY